MENEVIVCCDCGDTPKYALSSYKILHYRATSTPVVLKTHPKVAEFAEKLPEGSNIRRYLMTLNPGKGKKFAYSLKWDEKGDIIEQYDLMTGNKLKEDHAATI